MTIYLEQKMTKEKALEFVLELVSRFEEQLPTLKNARYKEHNLRMEYLNPFWESLGWDIHNRQGLPQSYKEVEQEDDIKLEKKRGAPDYCFRKNKDKRFFYLEAKKPIENIKDNLDHANQTRAYGWNGGLSISILSDFEEFSLYDCTKKPKVTDSVRTARLEYFTFRDYEAKWDFIWNTFSREAVMNGSIDQFASKNIKRGKETVDKEFLISLDNWRTHLAENISLRNKTHIDEDQLNFAVQHIIDRLIFLRIAEDRNIEPYGNLGAQLHGDNYYQNILGVFANANNRYNAGLFDPAKDQITATLTIDNKVVKEIVNDMYYPKSPYLFDVISVEILGSAYEQFLGKTITINNRGKAIIELKPEVRKAGGVYYTPQYIVDYIVENTVGKLTENKTPIEVAELKICDPACGSGSFLLGAYQFLLNWHLDYYKNHPAEAKKAKAILPSDGGVGGGLTTAEKKRILLNNIYGVDIDVNAVEVTKLSLLLKCMEGETQASIAYQMTMFNERVLPTMDNNIKSGNSLIDTDFYDGMIEFEERKIKPFNWQKAFPEVFSNGGFDAVIGNPPYVGRSTNFDLNLKDYIKKKFITSEGKFELYQLFIEKGSKIIKDKNSYISLITPQTWLSIIQAVKLRKYLVTNFDFQKLIYLGKEVFNASVDTLVFIIKSGQSTQKINIIEGKKILSKLDLDHTQVSIESISSEDYIIPIKITGTNNELINKIVNQSIKLEDIGLWSDGVKIVGEAKKFAFQNIKVDSSFYPMLVGSDVSRYNINWSGLYCCRDKDKIISKNATDIRLRSETVFEKAKIVIRKTGNSIIANIDDLKLYHEQSLFSYSLFNEKFELKYILAILNSRIGNYLLKSNTFSLKDTFPQIRLHWLKEFPIKENKKIQEQLILIVDQLLQLNKDLQSEILESKKDLIKSKIAHFEDKINRIVYELYGLTEEEIKIVENA